jgi:bifunctional UDP-N-acetylglucosamine pyrophosphorylase/glucosamine-1-phosphate N-acetyltransferase
MKNGFSVVLLAAGMSSRFWPLYEKFALPMFGKPLILHEIDHIQRLRPKGIVVVANESNVSMLRSILGKQYKLVDLVVQKGEGQGAALVAAAEKIYGPTLIVNSSDVYSFELLDQLVAKWQKQRGMLITARKVTHYYPGGYLKLHENGSVERIIEKPDPADVPSDLVRVVAEMAPSLQELADAYLPDDDPKEGEVAILNRLISKGHTCDTFVTNEFWTPIKYPWHLLDVLEYFLGILTPQRGKNLVLADNVHISGTVYLGDNVKIFENTKITGPCYIGNNTIIGNNNIIRASHIGANCVTGFNTDITRSYIGDNCWFHSNYIGDSVLEGNVSLGSGTVLANFRFDEGEIYSTVKEERVNTKRTKLGAIIGKNVRVGVNTSIMPGIKIGTNSLISAGIVVDCDIAENTFCYGKTELVLKKNER